MLDDYDNKSKLDHGTLDRGFWHSLLSSATPVMAGEKDPKDVTEEDSDHYGFYSDDAESDIITFARRGLFGEGSSYERKLAEDHTLYVELFSDAATIQEIVDAFGKYGNIVGIQMKSEDGSCLVNYSRPEEAYAAIQALNRVYTLPGGQHPIRVVREVARTTAVGTAKAFQRLASMIKADRERGEHKDIPINAVESGELSVESMSCLIMDGLRGEELLQMADEDTKRKEPREGGNEKRGKKI
ncbi:flowering time control protein FCA isoform X1 [Tanacetum coccineum]